MERENIIEALTACEKNPLRKLDPRILINPDRMEIILLCLAGREILSGKEGAGMALYRRWIDLVNGGDEFSGGRPETRYFSDYVEKRGFDSFCSAFASLIRSMAENGFDKERFIPLDIKGVPINGRHRTAAAILTGNDLWARDYPCLDIAWHWSCGRLCSQGFDDGAILMLLAEYFRVIPGCRAFILPEYETLPVCGVRVPGRHAAVIPGLVGTARVARQTSGGKLYLFSPTVPDDVLKAVPDDAEILCGESAGQLFDLLTRMNETRKEGDESCQPSH